MSDTRTTAITVDQFVAAPPASVWRGLTEPELLARWWVPGDVAPVPGHRFHLRMPGWGDVPCVVTDVRPHERFAFTFGDWTLIWTLVAEGAGTRLLLEHSGFDPDDRRSRDALDRMGRGWRDDVLPRLAGLAAELG